MNNIIQVLDYILENEKQSYLEYIEENKKENHIYYIALNAKKELNTLLNKERV
jgi:hypothetical protein